MSRKIEDLTPDCQEKYRQFESDMNREGIPYIVTCTRRTRAEQANLFAQGRTKPGPIVTWTLNSKHFTGTAFDFVIMANGKPDWMMHHRDMWDRAVEIGKDAGFRQVVGKDGKVKEFAHFEIA